MKKYKLYIVALLSATLLFTPIPLLAKERNVYEQWKQETILSPETGDIVPAGMVYIEFTDLQSDTIKIVTYEVYVDGILQETISKIDNTTYQTEIYTTEVVEHQLQIVAVSDDDYRLHSSIRTFAVSKKGMGLDKNKQMDDMQLSWYYNWDKEPSSHIDNIEYVPMIWSDYAGSIDWLQEEAKQYHTVLGFNEPDLAEQADITVQEAVNYQPNFTQSGLRIGAPVVAYDPSNNPWFINYADNIVWEDVDFIPIHVYYDWAGEGMADAFLKVVDDTYQKYQKPIWITEYGIANQWLYGAGNNTNMEQLKQYMRDTITGLEERDYVERYAWFSFAQEDSQGGATALYNQETGILTELGKLYQSLGNPKQNILADQYVEDIGYYDQWHNLITETTLLKNSSEYSQYINTATFEKALQDALQLETNISIREQERIDIVVKNLQEAYKELLKNNNSATSTNSSVSVIYTEEYNDRIVKTGDTNRLYENLFLGLFVGIIYIYFQKIVK
jgi:hypothetical protein